ncbi:carboxylesterase family protein [Pyxidicoccus fallax]|uniref:Carboxylic ester hydrolase n=1 Tax=Pyxidicoccus fallax TaxID=394095 RepID=A0A848LGR2_9BACT|nr:carboxylesterase family protein [Pyxidicoccus fallax]NMO16605.1 carboxylesterase family protein [Pyxidicoccus fallax]NPC80800.1 carboxylesterase family protein [Pyxidicoccus fallax]
MIIETDKGRIKGTTEERVHVFKGIPYAAPPVGDLRWRPPQEVTAWTDVRNAYTFGPACPQPVYEDSLDGSEPVGAQSEDCLYLNVWTSGVDASKLKPVMVWIHGGAFKIGASHITMFSGLPLAWKGAVVVALNYRLGNLGFFAHPALEAETGGKGPVNFGLLDQIAALEWVQRNIAAFGGDPNNVTLFGQSAGGVSVLALMASPLANGLFHKGIAQSPYAIPEHSREKAIEVGTTVATALFGLGPNATAAELRKVPAKVFSSNEMDGPDGEPIPVGGLAPVPVVDGVVLKKKIRQSFKDGEQKVLPLIIGSTSNEASVLAAFDMEPSEVLAKIVSSTGEDTAAVLQELKSLYANDPEVNPKELDSNKRFAPLLLRDMLFTMQARWISDQHSKKSSSWRYYFSYVTEADREENPYGVAHGNEVVYTMGTGDIFVGSKDVFTDNDRAMSQKAVDYWYSFANTGTPSGSVAWTKNEYGVLAPKDNTLKLDEELTVLKNFRRARLDRFILMYPILEAVLSGEAPEETEATEMGEYPGREPTLEPATPAGHS